MSLRAIVLLLLFALIAIFVGVNWTAFLAPTTLSLLFTRVEAPLGLVMLALAGLIATLFMMYIGYLQATAIFEVRRHARELHAQRKLADESELSRLTELRKTMEAALERAAAEVSASLSTVLARIDQRTTEVQETVEQTGTVLSSYLGEIEDRLEQRMVTMKVAAEASSNPGRA